MRKTSVVSSVRTAKKGMPSSRSRSRTGLAPAEAQPITRSGRSATIFSRLGSSPPPTEGTASAPSPAS
ncbi:MAG TPA: hypothetical protein VHG08_19985 [Longimicrobium sp.]|nr:hypothetical protein [Longimicrobium sp.]